MPTLDSKDLGVSIDQHVATVEIQRPPHNFFDLDLIGQIADTYAAAGRHAGVPRDRALRAGQEFLCRCELWR